MAYTTLIDSGNLTGRDGQAYRVYVDKDGYTGSVYTPQFSDPAFAIGSGNQGDDIDVPVRSSDCSLFIRTDTAALLTEIRKIGRATKPREYRVRVTKGGASFWTGYPIQGFVTTGAKDTAAREVVIQAKDTTGRLDRVDYAEPTGLPYTGKRSLISHVVTALGKLGITYSVLEAYAGVWAYGVADTWAIQIDANAFNPTDDMGAIRPRSAGFVLRQICGLFGLQLSQWNGKWRITRPQSYTTPASLTYSTYNSSAVKGIDATEATTVDLTSSAFLSGSDEIGGMEAVREARVTFNRGRAELLANGGFELWTPEGLPYGWDVVGDAAKFTRGTDPRSEKGGLYTLDVLGRVQAGTSPEPDAIDYIEHELPYVPKGDEIEIRVTARMSMASSDGAAFVHVRNSGNGYLNAVEGGAFTANGSAATKLRIGKKDAGRAIGVTAPIVSPTDKPSTYLIAGITASATSMTVHDASDFPSGKFVVKIENELIFVGRRSGNGLIDCVRGFGGTAAASHALNKTVDVSPTHAVVVDNPETLPAAPFVVQVDDEKIRVTARSGSVLTLERGYESTTATFHTSKLLTILFDTSYLSADVVTTTIKISTGAIGDGRTLYIGLYNPVTRFYAATCHYELVSVRATGDRAGSTTYVVTDTDVVDGESHSEEYEIGSYSRIEDTPVSALVAPSTGQAALGFRAGTYAVGESVDTGVDGPMSLAELRAREYMRTRRRARQRVSLTLSEPNTNLHPQRAFIFGGVRYWPTYFRVEYPSCRATVTGIELRDDGIITTTELEKGSGAIAVGGQGTTYAQQIAQQGAQNALLATNAITSTSSEITGTITSVPIQPVNHKVPGGETLILRHPVTLELAAVLTVAAAGAAAGAASIPVDSITLPTSIPAGALVSVGGESLASRILVAENEISLKVSSGDVLTELNVEQGNIDWTASHFKSSNFDGTFTVETGGRTGISSAGTTGGAFTDAGDIAARNIWYRGELFGKPSDYVSSGSLSNYLPKSGGTLTGLLTTAAAGVKFAGGGIIRGESNQLHVYAEDGTNHGTLVVQSLQIAGDTTVVQGETVALSDNFVLLNSDWTQAPTQNAGIEVKRGTSANAFLEWDEGLDRWGQRIGTGTFEPFTRTNAAETVSGTWTFSAALTLGTQATATGHAVRADRTVSITGTANQVTVTGTTAQNLTGNPAWTLSLPQNIHTAATPQFAKLGLGQAAGTEVLAVTGTAKVTGTLTLGADLLPTNNYQGSIGYINRKWLNLWVAELQVETLVASERRTTIGGRMNVGLGNRLAADLTAAATSIQLEYNNCNSGDIIHLEKNGQVEFMRIESAYSGTGPYTYTVSRNLDGSGANTWAKGDGVFNTGTVGTGFIDMYATNSLRSGTVTAGPAIAFMERTGTGYNDISTKAAIGRLKGILTPDFGELPDEYSAYLGTGYIGSGVVIGGRSTALSGRATALWHFDGSLIDSVTKQSPMYTGTLSETGFGLVRSSGGDYVATKVSGRFGGAVAVEQGTTNIIPNPLFNNGDSNWNRWVQTTVAIKTTVTPIGTKNVLECVTAGGAGAIYQGVYAGQDEAATYTVSVLARSVDGNDRQIDCYLGIQKVLGILPASGEWTTLSVSFTGAETNFSQYGIHLYLPNGSAIQFAAVQVEQKPFITSFVDGARPGGGLAYRIPTLSSFTLISTIRYPYDPQNNQGTDLFTLFTEGGATVHVLKAPHWGSFSIYDAPTNVWHYAAIPDGTVPGDWVTFARTFNAFTGATTSIVFNLTRNTYKTAEGNFGPTATSRSFNVIQFGGASNYNQVYDETILLPYAASLDEVKRVVLSAAPIQESPGQTVISGANIRTGRIQSENGLSYVDLNNGSAKLLDNFWVNSDKSGSIGGKINWDAQGNVTLHSSVTISWTSVSSRPTTLAALDSTANDMLNGAASNASDALTGLDATNTRTAKVQSTYIDATEIRSPNITGNTGKIANWSILTNLLKAGTTSGIELDSANQRMRVWNAERDWFAGDFNAVTPSATDITSTMNAGAGGAALQASTTASKAGDPPFTSTRTFSASSYLKQIIRVSAPLTTDAECGEDSQVSLTIETLNGTTVLGTNSVSMIGPNVNGTYSATLRVPANATTVRVTAQAAPIYAGLGGATATVGIVSCFALAPQDYVSPNGGVWTSNLGARCGVDASDGSLMGALLRLRRDSFSTRGWDFKVGRNDALEFYYNNVLVKSLTTGGAFV